MPQGGIHSNMISWNGEETINLLDAIKNFGHSWEKIKNNILPKRSVSSIRNRYQRINKFTGKTKNICNICGKTKKGHICSTSKYSGSVSKEFYQLKDIPEIIPKILLTIHKVPEIFVSIKIKLRYMKHIIIIKRKSMRHIQNIKPTLEMLIQDSPVEELIDFINMYKDTDIII